MIMMILLMTSRRKEMISHPISELVLTNAAHVVNWCGHSS